MADAGPYFAGNTYNRHTVTIIITPPLSVCLTSVYVL